jgi:hypothetical protein
MTTVQRTTSPAPQNQPPIETAAGSAISAAAAPAMALVAQGAGATGAGLPQPTLVGRDQMVIDEEAMAIDLEDAAAALATVRQLMASNADTTARLAAAAADIDALPADGDPMDDVAAEGDEGDADSDGESARLPRTGFDRYVGVGAGSAGVPRTGFDRYAGLDSGSHEDVQEPPAGAPAASDALPPLPGSENLTTEAVALLTQMQRNGSSAEIVAQALAAFLADPTYRRAQPAAQPIAGAPAWDLPGYERLNNASGRAAGPASAMAVAARAYSAWGLPVYGRMSNARLSGAAGGLTAPASAFAAAAPAYQDLLDRRPGEAIQQMIASLPAPMAQHVFGATASASAPDTDGDQGAVLSSWRPQQQVDNGGAGGGGRNADGARGTALAQQPRRRVEQNSSYATSCLSSALLLFTAVWITGLLLWKKGGTETLQKVGKIAFGAGMGGFAGCSAICLTAHMTRRGR